MDGHSGHSGALGYGQGFSKSSQSPNPSPSPSHSASASVPSSGPKRKEHAASSMGLFSMPHIYSNLHPMPMSNTMSMSMSHPSSLSESRDGALTSNDDDDNLTGGNQSQLESMSAGNTDGREDYEDEDEVEGDDQDQDAEEDSEEDDDSMRTFTAARLDNGGSNSRNVKPKTDNAVSTVKAEPNVDSVKEEKINATSTANNGQVGPSSGTVLLGSVKEEAGKVTSTEHIQTSGAYCAREESLKKEGFTKEIEMEKERWHGYIKDYDGGILMECKIDPKLPYIDLPAMIRRQRQEAGWTPEQWGHSRIRLPSSTAEGLPSRQSLSVFMRYLLKAMGEHVDAWPFKEPVDPRDVPDYYDIIKDPMDLKTMSKRVDSEQYYVTMDMFVADVKRMFTNARTYNSPETIYYKCANRLETFFSNKLQAGIQTTNKSQQ